MTIITIGLDTSKSWFQVHGVDADGQAVVRRKLPRSKVLNFFANLPPCTVGLEACGGAHYWARELAKLAHMPRLMPARYVRPYVKTNKHDAADAEACCEAVQRPGMRFVPTKTVEQQSMLMVHRVRDLLIRQRTAAVNALRGHLSEFGIVRPKGTASARELMSLVATDERVPPLAREALDGLVDQIRDTEQKIAAFNDRIVAMAKNDDVCRRLMTVLTIGPFVATALVATAGDPNYFSSGRHFAAWLGLTPKQHSTAGKERFGGISKRGDSYVRKLLIHGARATVHNIRSVRVKGAWVAGLLARRHFNVATVALANKTARIAWAVMTTGQNYRVAV
ncbi:IS110 family transposase [Mesorhizobium caraganae]|uniref:IS110 family transposase n=1 Tax=Mesorhizobium caraganae TaxID=483206 RepID=UPI0017805317|nr:IS110 family transposase [Mesorhizobium caraganae]